MQRLVLPLKYQECKNLPLIDIVFPFPDWYQQLVSLLRVSRSTYQQGHGISHLATKKGLVLVGVFAILECP